MNLAIACDHGAYALKEALLPYLRELGHTVTDYGTHSHASCDYPDFVLPAARAVGDGTHDRAIVLCTTGIGASITANKVRGIRCALVHDTWSAFMTRSHNDSNVLAMGAGVIGEALAREIIAVWLTTPYDGVEHPDGNHARRVGKINIL